MKLLLENWRQYLKEAPVGDEDVEWVQSYFSEFLKNTKQRGHIYPMVSLGELPVWLRKGAEGARPRDFARSLAGATGPSFAKALGEVSDKNRERFKELFLLLADAIEKGDVDAKTVSLNWYHMAMLVDTLNSGEQVESSEEPQEKEPGGSEE